MRSIDHEFYNSRKWRQVQADYMKKTSGLCERCRAKGLYVPAKIVHHKIHLNEKNIHDPQITYCFDNLESLCQECHNKEHFKRAAKRWKIDDGGRLILEEPNPPI